MTSTLCRIGDTVQLDEFHHGLLSSMLKEEIPTVLTLEQARNLTARVNELANSGMQYGPLLKGFLANIEAVLAA